MEVECSLDCIVVEEGCYSHRVLPEVGVHHSRHCYNRLAEAHSLVVDIHHIAEEEAVGIDCIVVEVEASMIEVDEESRIEGGSRLRGFVHRNHLRRDTRTF